MVIGKSFNQFFVNIGKELANKITITGTDPLSYLPPMLQSTIFLRPVEEIEVKQIIHNLKDASPGWDGVHAKVVKSTYNEFLTPLTLVLNSSLEQGFFPSQLKLARVVPIYKNGDKMSLSNYRPVSILPLFSKILERLMYNRLIAFISKNNILYKYQFGFRSEHSTNMALIILIDKIVSAIDRGDVVVGIFLDLKKAFDTVNHTILLRKLYNYGIRGKAYEWMKEYLHERKQFVTFNGTDTNSEFISCGVPQGSILGPLLFLLYINDIASVSKMILPIIFADDTNIFLSGKDVNDTISIFNHELSKIMNWLNSNHLSINIMKTNYMIFKPPRKKIQQSVEMKINSSIIEKVETTKFIGVLLDPTISWIKHIQYIRNKISRGLGIIAKAKKVFSIPTLITLYNSFVFPYFIYCIEVWGKAADTHLASLVKLQKRVVRTIKSAPYFSESKPIFKDLNLLNFSDIYKQRINTFMFKFVKNMLPAVVNELFVRNHDLNRRTTRQNFKLNIPYCRTALYQRTIKYQGVKEWN